MVATKKNITALGTIQENRRAAPREVSQVAGRKEFSYKVMWENVPKNFASLLRFQYEVKWQKKRSCTIKCITSVRCYDGRRQT